MSSHIKDFALSRPTGKWGISILAIFVVGLIGVLVGLIPLASLVVAGPFALGTAGYFLKVKRGENASVEEVFAGFKFFLHSFLAMLLISITIVVGFFLFIIPGVIATLRLSQTFFIMHDNPGKPALDCMKDSWDRMKGKKGDFFMFCLSFIGWSLLVASPLVLAFGGIYAAIKSGAFQPGATSLSPLAFMSLGGSVLFPIILIWIAGLFLSVYFNTSAAVWYDEYINDKHAELENFGEEVK